MTGEIKTVKELIELFVDDLSWHSDDVRETIKKLETYPDDTSIKKLVEDNVIIPEIAYFCARKVENRDLMKQVILNYKDPEYAHLWADTFCKDDECEDEKEEMRQIIVEAGEPLWIIYWLRDFGRDEEMKQIILQLKEPVWAYWWAVYTKSDLEEMKQIILESNNPEYAYLWGKYFGDEGEMKQVILNTKSAKYAYKWAEYIGDVEEMRKIVFESGDENLITGFNLLFNIPFKN